MSEKHLQRNERLLPFQGWEIVEPICFQTFCLKNLNQNHSTKQEKLSLNMFVPVCLNEDVLRYLATWSACFHAEGHSVPWKEKGKHRA